MNITITRSFSKKVQIKKFEEYVEFFCSAMQEVDEKDVPEASKRLDNLVQFEVNQSCALYEEEHKPIPDKKFDFKKDYSKLRFAEPKHADVGTDAAEHDTAQFIPESEDEKPIPF